MMNIEEVNILFLIQILLKNILVYSCHDILMEQFGREFSIIRNMTKCSQWTQ